ncbi:TPA: hypothetical protein QDZ36_002526 [Stenotrophomonas maltophilia]|nr:hypothetical protein [Stenotrophomonas maltophilia]
MEYLFWFLCVVNVVCQIMAHRDYDGRWVLAAASSWVALFAVAVLL